MITIRNRSNSPYDLPTIGGAPLRLPAMGEVSETDTQRFSPDYLELLKASGVVEVVDTPAKASKPAAMPTMPTPAAAMPTMPTPAVKAPKATATMPAPAKPKGKPGRPKKG